MASQSDVRKWAQDNGIEVPPVGRISADVVARYEAAQAATAPAAVMPQPAPEPDADAPVSGELEPDDTDVTDDVTVTIEPEVVEPEPEPEPAPAEAKTVKDYPDYAVEMQTIENGFIHAQRATGTDEIQRRLVDRGFGANWNTGLADEATQYAYAQFQASLGIAGTGIPDRASLEELGFRVIE